MAINSSCKIQSLLEKYGSADGKYLGKLVAVPPYDAIERFNFTLPKGKGTELWINFLNNLENNGYNVKKFDESLEVSSVDQAYYNLTQKQKDEMEGRIKQGLTSVASAVSDYEMLAHDLRKYKEFLKLLETNDEHSLRSIFIDEVDINTGANSIKQMVARWPTIIADFMTLGEELPEEVDGNKIKDKLKISKAEAVILSTKQRLYKNWKEIFGGEVKNRVKRLMEQANSRKKSIEVYKEWLKPLVARHKLYKEGLSTPETRKSTLSEHWHSPGQAISVNIVEIWAWQPILAMEPRRGTLEQKGGKSIEPYDSWIKENVILNKKEGLIAKYPGFDEKLVNKKVEEVSKMIQQESLYFVFHQIQMTRAVIKLPDGSEVEDVTINTKAWFLSQNALLAFLLELKIKEEQFEQEINQLLGISSSEDLVTKSEDELENIIKKWKNEEEKEKRHKKMINSFGYKFKKVGKGITKIASILGLNIVLSKFGPYEHNFKDRIVEFYLKHLMKNYYAAHVTNVLREEAGVGK